MIRYRVHLTIMPAEPYADAGLLDHAAWRTLTEVAHDSDGAITRPGVVVNPHQAQVSLDVTAASVGAALQAVEGVALEALPGRVIEARIQTTAYVSVPGGKVGGTTE